MDKNLIILLILVSVGVVGVAGYTIYKQTSEIHCEACGMIITEEIKQHINIIDGSGEKHYACCQTCMFRLLDPIKGYSSLHIVTYCDYYGPEYQITIDSTQNGNNTVASPDTALLLLGGKIVASCANNRIAYNSTAAEKLINQGYSSYTMGWQKNPLPQGTPIVSISMAAQNMAQKGISYTAPSMNIPIILGGFGIVIILFSIITIKNLNRD